MAAYEAGGDTVSAEDRNAAYWLDCIGDAQKFFAFWNEKSDSIDKLYADLKKMAATGVDREYKMFWANMEVLKPAIYSRSPVPVVVPRWADQKELPRKASEMLERALILNFEEIGLDTIMLQVRDDLATVGRGIAWVRLEEAAGGDRNVIDHLDRADFLHEPARKWAEVGWVAKRAWLTREQVRARFGDEIAQSIKLKTPNYAKGEVRIPDYKGESKAEVWEIWSKTRGVVVWVSPGVEEVLDARDPYLKLDRFFPCPKPAYATLERRSLVPVPDFCYYRDQLEEINELTARISSLAEALKLKGFYPGGAGDLAEAIEAALKDTSNNARLIPVANYQNLGGASLRDSVVWLPIVEVANTITSLVALRRQLIDDVYQISGISDIMRGATDPEETLGAQRLKSQYGSIRIRDRQSELVRFARDLTRISAEIMAENYTPRQFADMAQMDLPTEADIAGQVKALGRQALEYLESPEGRELQQNVQALAKTKSQMDGQIQQLQATVTMEKIVGLLREQRIRPFVLEIETDSTIQPDENAEKASRTEFLGALSGAMQQLVPLVAQQPATAPFAAETLKFAVAPFRAGRALAGAIEQYAETVKREAQQAQQSPQSSAEQIKAQQEDKKLAFDKQKHDDEMAVRRQEIAHRQRLEARQSRAEADQEHISPVSGSGEAGTVLPSAYSQQEMLEQLAAGQLQIAQAIEQLAGAIAAPKSVTTPDGRTYTTAPARMN
ncbi:hypothetical protein [Taklimakanibacter deserti]|uniref:hypothetical protein n=1 Tax=Taklimakanibacter deserti TaxID=2267839 RepID=UPI000E6581D6